MEREENIRDNIIKLPKVELHCHLDGSLSREFVEKRLGRTVQEAELSVSDDCTSLAQYLEKFDLPGQCIQDEKGLEGAAYDVLKGIHRQMAGRRLVHTFENIGHWLYITQSSDKENQT